MVAPIIAAKTAQGAAGAMRALTGDIYAAKFNSIHGTGKRQQLVEHEVHINPVTLAVGTGVAAVAGMTALWVAQMRLAPTSTTVDLFKWAWPDGTFVDMEALPRAQLGIAPTKVGRHITGWRKYVGGFPSPFIYTDTEPADLTGWVAVEYDETITARATVVDSKTTIRFGLKERRGFSILGGDQELPGVTDVVGFVSPITWLATKLGR